MIYPVGATDFSPLDPNDPGLSQYRFRNRMSQRMLDCLLRQDELRAEVEFCHRQVWRTFDAGGDFPGVALNGQPAVAGTWTVDLRAVEQYWTTRRDAAIHLLPRDRETDAWIDALGADNILYGKRGKRPPEEGA